MKKVLWFRRDLRVDDSMLLAEAGEVLPLFIFDTTILDRLPKNDRRIAFIFNQVLQLKAKLKTMGLELALFYGNPLEIFAFLKTLGFDTVYASVDYDDYARKRDTNIAALLHFHTLHDCYLFEPNEVLKKDGTPYLVFTPYYKACKELYTQFHVLKYRKAHQTLTMFDYSVLWSIQNGITKPLHVTIGSLGFESLHVNILSPQKTLENFVHKINNYVKKRDFLDENATSHLSIHLRFGTISIREVVRFLMHLKNKGYDIEPFFRQLIFREFYAYLLYHFPKLAWENYRYTPLILNDTETYERFCTAQIGYPIIDAAITELLSTGFMHNRARMIVGSFFTKHLMLPWQKGEAFFAKYLLDYDASSNILSWQWCSGSGIDPQPYFRMFNPYTQSLKFDTHALYIKHFLPKLEQVPAFLLHKEAYLLEHDIKEYPKPIIEHTKARKRFLEAVTS